MNKLKLFFGPLYPIVCAVFALLVIFALSRLGLTMWHFDRVTNADGWIRIFTSGLRVDFASICYLFILPALLTSLISGEHWLGRIWNWVLRLWITAG
ncbi:LTA synthase family protein, partial [Vibrio cholerae]